MNLRTTAKAALGELIAIERKAHPISSQEMYKRLGDVLKQMHGIWAGGQGNLPYAEPWCRLAFLCAHVPPNSDALFWLIWWMCSRLGDHVLGTLNASGALRVCVVGGGPGTELLGIARYLIEVGDQITHAQPKIQLLVLDTVPAWKDTFDCLVKHVKAELQENPSTANVIVEALFESTAGQAPNADIVKGRQFDLYLLNYVMSELRTPETREAFRAFMDPIAAIAPNTAVFVSLDMYRDGSEIIANTNQLFHALNIRRVRHERERFSKKRHEWSRDMEPYSTEILEASGWNIRTSWSIYWYVGTKHPSPPGHPALEAEIV